ncbi:MAG: hypothetical protein HC817_02970 [Saprospiraceae bacterium]|nr:hypothetical protein [Saprospiraceae bacterium]
MLTIPQPLSNVQLELLKVYSAGVPDEWLVEIREMLAQYMLEKARDEADKIWQAKGYSEKTIEKWLKKY